MNRRQKKKKYKKLYGHNPPKGADGRYMFHVQYSCDLAAGQYRKPVFEQTEEPPVVVARILTERRKKCKRKEWRASRK